MTQTEARSSAEIWMTLSEVDGKFFQAIHELLDLYDLVDIDRDFIREEMSVIHGRWTDTVGAELAVLDDAKAIEDGLAEVFGTE